MQFETDWKLAELVISKSCDQWHKVQLEASNEHEHWDQGQYYLTFSPITHRRDTVHPQQSYKQ